MFVNYFKHTSRDSPINIFVARVLLSLYAVWKLWSYDFDSLQHWPSFLFKDSYNSFLLLDPRLLGYIWIEVLMISFLLLLFLFGYKTRYSGFSCALLLSHIAGIHYSITNSSTTWLPVVYLLIIFSIYSGSDKISLDNLLSLKRDGVAPLNQTLRLKHEKFDQSILVHFLIVTGLIYFFTGFSKILIVGFHWGSSQYMNKLLLREYLFHLNALPAFSAFIIKYNFLGLLCGSLTIILEIGFIVAILLKRDISLFVIGLGGMHLMILVTMEIFFLDQLILYLLLVPWDTIAKKIGNREEISIVYDNNCLLCASVLQMFKYLDASDKLHFYSVDNRPEEFRHIEDFNFNSEMYLHNGIQIYSGFYAFRYLFAKYWYFFPMYRLLYLKFVEGIGVRLYKYIAINRQWIYGCSL